MMLILTRRIGERIMIGNDIIVTVVGVNVKRGKDFVQIGVDAPKEVKILREEILEHDKEEERKKQTGKKKPDPPSEDIDVALPASA